MLRLLLSIFLFILLYYLFKVFFGIIIPLIRGKSAHSYSSARKHNYSNKKEGDITIEYKFKDNKIFPKDEGEYIDYKDIKD